MARFYNLHVPSDTIAESARRLGVAPARIHEAFALITKLYAYWGTGEPPYGPCDSGPV